MNVVETKLFYRKKYMIFEIMLIVSKDIYCKGLTIFIRFHLFLYPNIIVKLYHIFFTRFTILLILVNYIIN